MPRQDGTRVFELLDEVAERIHDDRSFAAGIRRSPYRMHPLDAHSLEVPEVRSIVDVLHGIHVAPSDGDRHLVDQLLFLGDVEPHALAPVVESSPHRERRIAETFQVAHDPVGRSALLSMAGLGTERRDRRIKRLMLSGGSAERRWEELQGIGSPHLHLCGAAWSILAEYSSQWPADCQVEPRMVASLSGVMERRRTFRAAPQGSRSVAPSGCVEPGALRSTRARMVRRCDLPCMPATASTR